MSFMLEVLYGGPTNQEKEVQIARVLAEFGGHMTYKEEPSPESLIQTVCLTYEFDNSDAADAAAYQLRKLGDHVEGPMDYGDD